MADSIHITECKWWGWGTSEKTFDIHARPDFWNYLIRHFSLPQQPILPVPREDDFSIPECRIDLQQLQTIAGIVGDNFYSTSHMERLKHAVGKSYHDLIRLRYRIDLAFPDLVVYPREECHIQKILEWAEQQHIAIIPFGGGTSVVGGVEAKAREFYRAVATLDLRLLNRVLDLDRESLAVEVEAGIMGPALESHLSNQGFTLGHSPESFEYSTVGGWIATRSSGQFSTRYGSMEQLLESVRMITPRGVIETRSVPASAAGPSIKQIILGSEGTLGIITRARLRISPLPQKKFSRAYLFQSFEEGQSMVRELMTTGGKPTLLRLSDGIETDWVLAMARLPKGKTIGVLVKLLKKWLATRGFVPQQRSLLLMGWEGTGQEVTKAKTHLYKIMSHYKSFDLGKWPVEIWHRHRYDNPYMRDEILNYGLLIDTLETAGEWRHVMPIYREVRTSVEATFQKLAIHGIIGAHLSHLYPQGSSLYFIILAQPHMGNELSEWWSIKIAASNAILTSGGTISHHHGVGVDHARWYTQELSPLSIGALQNLKRYLDPVSILNPGKLLPD